MDLYHITTKENWKKAQDQGFYDFCALKTDGFIHLSTKEQYLQIANKFFKEKDNLVLLKIDSTKLKSRVLFEKGFPHLYGPLNLEAVISMSRFDS